MFRRILAISFLMMVWGLLLQAQEVSFTASAPQQVAAGETFRVTYTLDARPDDFIPPAFSGLQVLAGPSQSSSSSTQIINSQVTTTVSFSYSYVMQAASEGNITIAPAKVSVKGKVYESNPVTITVSGRAAPGAQSTPSRPGEPRTTAPAQADAKDLFVRASVSKTNPYQSEQVIVTYRIYTRIPVSNYSIERLPSYQGFWSENLTGADAGTTTTEVVDGISYRVAEIRRVALYAQRTGEIIIEPLEVEAVVRLAGQQRRGSIFDEFFGGSPFDAFQNVNQTIRSNALRLQVKPLPTQNRPSLFKGMVGNLEVSARLEPSNLRVNDAANLIVTINGRGNLRMVEKPEIAFPTNLEVFDPNVTDNIRSGASGISGSRTYDFTLIPRTSGTFEIPSIQLVYFDPSSERYITKTTEPFTLEVTGSPGSADGAAGQASREQVRNLASDIRFIHSGPFELRPLGSMFYRSNLFYLLLVLPILLFAGFMIYWRQQINFKSNKALQRNRQAEKTARKRLKKANHFLQQNNAGAFYDEISHSLWGYIGDKLNIPGAQLSRERVNHVFQEKKVAPHLADKFLETLEDCEYARFAPGSPQMLMDETYQKTMTTIISLEKELRNKNGVQS